MEAGAVVVDEAVDLDGLTPEAIASLERNARDRGLSGHLITLKLPTPQPVLESLRSRDLRERVFEASVTRGSGADPGTDTRDTLLELARLRAERARLLGYPHHAAYVAEDGTARTTEAVNAMLERLAPSAVRNARAEAVELAAALEADVPGGALEPWDWTHYAERVRHRRYEFDDAVLRPYLDAERVLRDGVFFAARRLYGVTFTERPDLVGYADDVRVFEVADSDGGGLGLFLLDLYARPGKRGGAWMTSLVHQSRLLEERPVVTNTLNVDRPPAGQPTLLAWDEVITLFHEFGHALHGLFSAVRYPSLSGTGVPRDFVEYPSQVNEMWATHPEVLARYARHHGTGEPLAPDVAERLRTSQQYGEGFRTTEYLAAAVLDQAWHQVAPADLPTTADGVEPFEAAALRRAGLADPLVPPRYRSAYFNHTFGGGYDAGYYAYIWSEVLDADTVDWFVENGGLEAAAGARFREALLSRGYSGDPMAAFRALRGRDPVIEPLLERRGLR
jgi:peptidyl-dipeptidase Dcp